MSLQSPGNDLERALAVAMTGPHGYPDLFRRLREESLTFLMPWHPEMEGTIELREGEPLGISFWSNGGEQVIPVFTSDSRAREAMEAIGEKSRRCCLGSMEGEALFRILQTYQTRVVINPACLPGGLHLDMNAVRMLADGSILHPVTGRDYTTAKVKIVSPADYPTSFLQPLFEFLRRRDEVQAAWLFESPEDPPAEHPHYVFAVLAVDAEEQLEQDFVVVAQNARPPGVQFGVLMIDPRKPAERAIIGKYPPFFAAPGFRFAGGSLPEEE